jgi:hypothetical protein
LKDRPLSSVGIEQILHRAARKAHLEEKKFHPHAIRHSSCTESSKKYTDGEMKIFYGWNPGSRMPGVYTHLTGGEVKKKWLRLIGKAEEKEEKNILKPKRCPQCNEEKPPQYSFCPDCGSPLDLMAAVTIQERSKKVNQFLDTIMEKAKTDKDWALLRKRLFEE